MKKTIARKFIVYIILFSSLITLFITAGQLFLEYRHDLKGVQGKLQQVKHSYGESLAQAVWLADRKQIKLMLNGIVELPDIVYARVKMTTQELIYSGKLPLKGQGPSLTMPLKYLYNNKLVTIGHLEVFTSLDDIYRQLLNRLGFILLANAFKTSLVALFIYFLFMRLVGRHLQKIARFVGDENDHDLDRTLQLEGKPTQGDELDIVAKSLNQLRHRLLYRIEEIHQQRQLLAQTLNSIGDAVIATDQQGRVVNMNPVAEALTGWTLQEAKGKLLEVVFPIVDASTRQAIPNPVDKVLSKGEVVYLSNHTTLLSRNGNAYQIADSAAPIRNDDEIVGVVLVFNDVTEQYELREQLKKSRQDLLAIMDNMPALVYVKDKQGRYTFVNQSWKKYFATSDEHILGKTDFDLFPHESAIEFKNNDQDVWVTGRVLESEEHLQLEDGEHIYLSTKFPLFDSQNQVYAICGVSTDITENKRYDEIIRAIAEGVSSQTGKGFFHALTQKLSEMFQADYAFIAFLEQGRNTLETLSLCHQGEIVENTRYELANTPCASVLEGSEVIPQSYIRDVQKMFPEAKELQNLGISSYVGVPLVDHAHNTLGIISVMAKKEMKQAAQVVNIIKIFAARVVAEIERLDAESALRESEQKYQLLANTSPVGIFYTDKEGHCLYVNNKWVELTGVPYEQAVADQWSQTLHPDDRDAVFRHWQHTVEQGEKFNLEYRFLHTDGKVVWVLGNTQPHIDEQGRIQGYIGTITDISERKQIEHSLNETTHRLIDAQAMAHVGSWELDLVHNVLQWLDEVYNIFDVSKQERKRLSPTELFEARVHPKDLPKVNDAFEQAVQNKTPYSIRHRLLLPDGQIRHVHERCEVEYSTKGSPLRALGTVQDITEQILLEENLLRSQKLEAIGKLTGGIAHDFNNMLGVILGYTELLAARFKENAEAQNYIEEIRQAGERGAQLTRKLLHFSREKNINEEICNLNQLLESAYQMLQKTLTARITLIYQLEEQLWNVKIDKSDFENALVNLCINAMHAIEGNGEIIVRTENVPIKGMGESKHYVCLIVADNGCGMDEQTRGQVFEPFFTTKGDKGTGLGLSQVYGFVERCHGMIKVHSQPGKGTEFKLYLPKEDGQPEQQKPGPVMADDMELKGKGSILVVDDEQSLLILASEILVQNGYQVYQASNAQQALEILAQHPVDLLFSDVIMPEMDGYQLAKKVQQLYPKVKIQLSSGYTDDRHLEMVIDELHNNLLHKPYQGRALLQKVAEHLS